ncbi:MAG: hypothetical protein IPN96_21635 [Anaerolineales bacterium]|nr:hypothetical protein [Anaerolineales bacterium]
MINEPQIYRHSPFQVGLVVFLFGIIGIGLLFAMDGSNYLFFIPAMFLLLIVFLFAFHSLTTKFIITNDDISVQSFLGTKSLRWGEINRVSGRGFGIKLYNLDEDVAIAPNPQLSGYDEIVDVIGMKRPELFNPLEYSEITKSLVNLILLPLLGVMVMGVGIFLFLKLSVNEDIFPILFLLVIGLVIVVSSFAAPQSLTMDGKSLIVKYILNQKTFLANEIQSIELKFQSTRNGKIYFVMINLIGGKSVRLSGLSLSLPIVYLTLKNWHRKSTVSL